jgi:hypothetical protein
MLDTGHFAVAKKPVEIARDVIALLQKQDM